MTIQELYRLLDVPQEVVSRLNDEEAAIPFPIDEAIMRRFYCRTTTKEGLEALQGVLGEDADGMRQLCVLLHEALKTWDQYAQRGISKEIFAETMKFVPRFLNSEYAQTGTWRFRWSWWFWRQLSMAEYRVGCMEYELVEENGERFVSLHIPSDADMSAEAIDESFADFRAFLRRYEPEWTDVPWKCDSWLLSPALPHLLPEDSRILAFQRRFTIEKVNEESLGVLNWVFPPHTEVTPDLPENTSLQKRMKAWLLSGNKVGWTAGTLR